ncbi:electron transfer complex ferredoxin TmcB [Desulfovibrio inopinatus]|uniref:electron transfer complex ferredoxin TmcB n=1 Tax=Desulfovibrio inopinatus TaxID=102109 RepID=UPI0004006F37|nr:(Fe-S)-binding protein [Desulfovibrio inopinatus]
MKFDRKVEDAGLMRGVAALTPDKIEKTIKAVLDGETGAKLKMYAETCVRCGMCSQACHFYVSHDNDPTYSPAGKVHQTMSRILETKGRLDPEEIYKIAQIAYTECNLCKRCVHYCPLGIDTGYIMLVVRRICYKLGVVPQYIHDTTNSHSATYNQMWIKDDEWVDSLQWQEDEARDEFPDLRIPVDKEGAEIMYSVIAPEPKFRTHLIYQAAAIMHQAGVDWTMPSSPGWDNSDLAMFSGDNEIMGRNKRRHFECAMDLKAKRIVMGECGHAFRSIYDMGNRWLGWKMYPIEVVHAVEFYWELISSGKIKIKEKIKEPVTIQDPCNIIRGRGLYEASRKVAAALCENIVEMTPNGVHNYCCAAGGGIINCGPPFKNTRTTGNRAKADQIKATGVKLCIVPCHNCHGGLEDINHYYKLGIEMKFFGDLIYQLMEKPEA